MQEGDGLDWHDALNKIEVRVDLVGAVQTSAVSDSAGIKILPRAACASVLWEVGTPATLHRPTVLGP
jgi:hypothetical protein